MAITLIQDPQIIMPAYNTIAYTVDSTNKTQCNFRYLCDVYVTINGVSTYVTRLTQFPFGDDGFATFKVNRVLEDYVSSSLHRNLFGFVANAADTGTSDETVTAAYNLEFGEEYDNSTNCDAGTTVYANLLDLGMTAFVWNGALQYEQFPDYDGTTFVMNSNTGQFLTGNPGTYLVREDGQFTLNFFNFAILGVDDAEVNTYDINGVLLGTYRFVNGVIGGVISTVGAGPDNLNNTTLSSGAQPVITDTVAYYTFHLRNGGVQCSEQLIFEIDRRCTRWYDFEVWWLNRLGGFDSFTFTQQETRNLSISRDEYSKLFGGITGSPPEWTYTVGDRGTTVSNVDALRTYTMRSNWLTQAQGFWLEDLFTSPEVYVRLPSLSTGSLQTDWTPVVVTSTSFETKAKVAFKNIDYVIAIKEANKVNIQRN